jgi:hypothetical protein
MFTLEIKERERGEACSEQAQVYEEGHMQSSPPYLASKPTTDQYDKLRDHAIAVFGTQANADEWLARPCSRLDNRVPAEIIEDAIGLQTVEEYLQRIEFGVYQ